MYKNRIISGALALFTFIIFYYLIPVTISANNDVYFSVFGSIILVLFLTFTLLDIKNFDLSSFTSDEPRGGSYVLKVFGCVISFILFIVIFGSNFSNNENKELQKHGILVSGKIIDGEGKVDIKGNGSFYVNVEFKDSKNSLQTYSEKVSESEFNDLKRNEVVELIYSSRVPTLIKIIATDEDVFKYKGIKSREISIEDLLKIFVLDNKSTLSFLNSINYRWISTSEGNLANQHKELFIDYTDNTLSYFTHWLKSDSLTNEMYRLSFKKIDKQYIREDLSSLSDTLDFANQKYLVQITHFSLFDMDIKSTPTDLSVIMDNSKDYGTERYNETRTKITIRSK